ncbi:GNAT family N-acetyltransferase [Streptomyces sp. ET3-23]|uniref:GNAT family N-acetyltransferase n=1 Tax=Streptomyces sp. ET3-23 TaxID=2885643 RepID=UPI001D12E12F|nr:GNAT family N-acetyltransferase [Streptomyces sp. ET3-23]MCC2276469.1 GNAT family N-acetyltransferase [Streptomyces sp. ET3-23]
MTTTLRPAAPEQRTDDGGRSRRYEIRVNSRPVGSIDLATDRRFGPGVGRIVRLAVEVPDRRRGRGTVAALAAEEVLRGWGCRRVEVCVAAGQAAAGLPLATALGYTERNRTMGKPLSAEPPSLPDGTGGRPMTEAEFAVWEPAARAEYAERWTAYGVPADRAQAHAEADHRALLPDGPATDGMLLRVLSHHGTPVGTLWAALRSPAGFVYRVEVDPAHRGQGHGRSLMFLAETELRAAGADRLRLNVFADNAPARRLYESLGYEPEEYHLSKELL